MTRPERPIAADWLALRRAADTEARDRAAHLLTTLADGLTGTLTVFDIGAGTGANQAYLAPRLEGPSRWVLLDHDAELLNADGNVGAQRVLGGIQELYALVAAVTGPRLVTCSALLDLLTTGELDELAAVLSRLRVPGLFSLTVDGSMSVHPSRRDDDQLTAAFNDHQARRGRPGPAAADYLERRCAADGMLVTRAATPWLLGAGSEPLIERLLVERAAAAVEARPGLAEAAQSWLDDRLADLAVGTVSVRIGHVDLLVRPSPESGS